MYSRKPPDLFDASLNFCGNPDVCKEIDKAVTIMIPPPFEPPASGTGSALAVLYVGCVGKKHKFVLLDDRDMAFVRALHLRLVVETSSDGDGARTIVAVRLDGGGSSSVATTSASSKYPARPVYLHELIYMRHCGDIGLGMAVVHRNGIPTDNRVSNLHLRVPGESAPDTEGEREFVRQSQEEFKNALAQVPPPASWASHSVIHQYHQQQLLHNASLSPNGDEMLPASTTHNSASGANSDPAAPTISTATTTTISTADPCQGVIFHECQNLTCWRTEQRPGEYALCAGCMQVRYCSAACQERDWRNHRDFCTLLRSDRRPHSRLIPPR